jgi:hypothetical protein
LRTCNGANFPGERRTKFFIKVDAGLQKIIEDDSMDLVFDGILPVSSQHAV